MSYCKHVNRLSGTYAHFCGGGVGHSGPHYCRVVDCESVWGNEPDPAHKKIELKEKQVTTTDDDALTKDIREVLNYLNREFMEHGIVPDPHSHAREIVAIVNSYQQQKNTAQRLRWLLEQNNYLSDHKAETDSLIEELIERFEITLRPEYE